MPAARSSAPWCSICLRDRRLIGVWRSCALRPLKCQCRAQNFDASCIPGIKCIAQCCSKLLLGAQVYSGLQAKPAFSGACPHLEATTQVSGSVCASIWYLYTAEVSMYVYKGHVHSYHYALLVLPGCDSILAFRFLEDILSQNNCTCKDLCFSKDPSILSLLLSTYACTLRNSYLYPVLCIIC